MYVHNYYLLNKLLLYCMVHGAMILWSYILPCPSDSIGSCYILCIYYVTDFMEHADFYLQNTMNALYAIAYASW